LASRSRVSARQAFIAGGVQPIDDGRAPAARRSRTSLHDLGVGEASASAKVGTSGRVVAPVGQHGERAQLAGLTC
jgi:hypothetical protein